MYINEYILKPIDVDLRVDILIGIIGILVSIVIFIAETMNSSKTETEKRLILKKTRIEFIMIASIAVLVLCVLKEVVPINKNNINEKPWLYFSTQFLVNGLMLFVVGNVIYLFRKAIKLNVDSKYNFDEYNKYINARLDIINKKIHDTILIKSKDKTIENYIKNNNYLSFYNGETQNMIPIKSKQSGTFLHYKISMLKDIVDRIDKINKTPKLTVDCESAIVAFALKNPGRITKGDVVAYCNRDYLSLSDIIANSIELDNDSAYQDSEIDLILKDIFLLAEENIRCNYDSNNRIYNLFKYLYDNKMHVLLNISFNYLQTVVTNKGLDNGAYKEISKLLNKLLGLAYKNHNIEHYKIIYDYLQYCYSKQLEMTDDIRQTTYEYTEQFIRFNYYAVRQSSDSAYYDVLLANLLKYIFLLINRNELIAVDDIFRNAMFRGGGQLTNNIDNFQILNLQFTFGFINGLIVMASKEKFMNNSREINSETRDNLKRIIDDVNEGFVYVDDHVKALEYFLKYYTEDSEIYKIYRNFDLDFDRTKYRNSWSGTYIAGTTIIGDYIKLFNIVYSVIEDNDIPKDITTRNNLYFYEDILKDIENDKKSPLRKIIADDFNSVILTNSLKKLIEMCKEDEQRYIRTNRLSKERIDIFKDRLVEEISRGDNLLTHLKEKNKYKLSTKKSSKFFGYNQIISREIFFENTCGTEDIAKSYAEGMLDGIDKEYMSLLDKMSTLVSENEEEFINSYFNKGNGIIIADYEGCEKLIKIGVLDNSHQPHNDRFKLIKVKNTKDIYIVYNSFLPTIYMMDIMNSDNEFEVKNNIAIKILDCSKDKEARMDVFRNADWLKEKGNEIEQLQYLKGQCILRIFIAPAYETKATFKCHKIALDNE